MTQLHALHLRAGPDPPSRVRQASHDPDRVSSLGGAAPSSATSAPPPRAPGAGDVAAEGGDAPRLPPILRGGGAAGGGEEGGSRPSTTGVSAGARSRPNSQERGSEPRPLTAGAPGTPPPRVRDGLARGRGREGRPPAAARRASGGVTLPEIGGRGGKAE